DFVSVAFRQFPTRRSVVDIDTRLAVLTYEYFPHQARGGKCPAKLSAELQTNERARLVAPAICADNAARVGRRRLPIQLGLALASRTSAACLGWNADV